MGKRITMQEAREIAIHVANRADEQLHEDRESELLAADVQIAELESLNAKLLAACKAILQTPDSFSDFVEAMALAEAAVAEAEGEA